MSWASRRRTMYLGGVFLVIVLSIAIPLLHYFLTIKPTCFDGTQNQGETAIDEGGPCLKLDPNALSPATVLWARSFKVRDGSYTAIAYVQNANPNAGVAQLHYHVGLYDSDNVLVAERSGSTYLMPGGITPVLETGINTGFRTVVHVYFQITDDTPTWERMTSPASQITVSNQQISDINSAPRLNARVENTSFMTLSTVRFVAVVFDPYGNAIAASGTALPTLNPNDPQRITFTWPDAFSGATGRIDITPLLPPVEAPPSSGQ